jgi:hypothetical protein
MRKKIPSGDRARGCFQSLSLRELERTPRHSLFGAMNPPLLVIAKEACLLRQSIWQRTVDCRSRLGSFAMTNSVCPLAGAALRRDEAIQVNRHGAPRDDKQVLETYPSFCAFGACLWPDKMEDSR